MDEHSELVRQARKAVDALAASVHRDCPYETEHELVAEIDLLRLALDMAADDAERFSPKQYLEMAKLKVKTLEGGCA